MTDDLTELTETQLSKLEIKLARALSVQHKIFADRLAQGASQTKAATDAGYAEKGARNQSVRLVRRKDICAYVHVLREQQRRVAGITLDRMVRRHMEAMELAFTDRDWSGYKGICAEVAKLLAFYPEVTTNVKASGKIEHEHTGAVGINTNYMSNEVLQEIFELKRKETANETGSSKVH